MYSPQNIAKSEYKESATTRHTHTGTGQSDPYVLLHFAGSTKTKCNYFQKNPDFNAKLLFSFAGITLGWAIVNL